MTRPPDVDVLVVGAGISGLACAAFLRERGVGVRVVEGQRRSGGVIETRRESGYLFEIGPNSTLDSKPALGRLVAAAGLSARLRAASPNAKNRFILRRGVLYALPTSPPGLFATRLFSARAKLRIAAEMFVKARIPDDDESVADFVRRRFGREFLEYAIGPFVSGVYAGDPERLSLRSAFPVMHEFETAHGGVIRGAARTAKERRARRAAQGKTGPSQLVSFDDGMAVLVDRIAERLGEALRTDSEVCSLRSAGGAPGWVAEVASRRGGEEVSARAVVLAVPTEPASALVAHLDAGLSALLAAVPYAPVATVFCGWDRSRVSHALDGFGFLVPAVEGRDILGTIFSSTLFDGRAPEGKVALTTFIGGVRRPELVADLDEGALVDRVVDQLGGLLGVSGAPEFFHVQKWTRAIPQFVVGHRALTDAIARLETEHSGLFFCTNYQRGVSVGDCVEHAASVAEAVARALPAPRSPLDPESL
jgi:oxygen-dependent protoporphyrinogen oxidase